jgi:DNA modification methylase
MPESVTDRPTKSHEYIFLLTKSARYYYDADVIKEPLDSPLHAPGNKNRIPGRKRKDVGYGREKEVWGDESGRNKRSVWTIPTAPYPGAHYATFPPKLPEICIKAGSREGDTVLDPFNGHGTTGLVAARLGRNYVGIEINTGDCEATKRRIEDDAPLLNDVEVRVV